MRHIRDDLQERADSERHTRHRYWPETLEPVVQT